MYGTFFAAKTKHISLGQQQCESRLAVAWCEDVTSALERIQKEDEEKNLAGAKRTHLPASECDDVLAGTGGMPAATCELDMELEVPAGVDVDTNEPMLLSLNVTASEVKEAACGEMVLDPTDSPAYPGVIPGVVMLLSDDDSLFDDDVDDLPFEATSTPCNCQATLLQSGEMMTSEIRMGDDVINVDKCPQPG